MTLLIALAALSPSHAMDSREATLEAEVAAEPDIVAIDEAVFDTRDVSVEDIAARGVRPMAHQALSYVHTDLVPWGPEEDDIWAATLWLCTQSGGVNVAPGQMYCTTEYVPATCEEIGYVAGDISQSGSWLWSCVDDPAGGT